MTVEEKWADRIYRAPKKGSDYTSTKVNAAVSHRDRLHPDTRPSERDDAQLNAMKSELGDMQLVVNHLEQRIDQLESLPQQDDGLDELQDRTRRLEIFALMLIAALIIAVTLKVLDSLGIQLIPQLIAYVAQAISGLSLV